MAWTGTRSVAIALLLGSPCLLTGGPAAAQPAPSAVVLRGDATRTGIAPAVVAPGSRVASPGTWSEIAFSDGTSIVLEPGAVVTFDGTSHDPASGRLNLRCTLVSGRARVAASDNTDVLLQAGGAAIEISAATAVVTAGPNGSVTLVSGRRVVLRQAGREDVLRRPGFAVAFNDGGPQRQTRQQLSESLNPFAPVAMGGMTPDTTEPLQRQAITTDLQAPRSDTFATNNQSTARFQQTGAGTSGSGNTGTGNTGTGSTGGGGTGAGGTGAGNVTPRVPANFTLASALLPGGGQAGSSIAPPGANSVTTSIDGAGNFFNEDNIAGAIVQVDVKQLGTGRLRRFTPESSGYAPGGTPAATRDDSGLVAFNGPNRPFSVYFRDLAQSPLGTASSEVFYDATVNVGSLRLTLAQENPPHNFQDPSRDDVSTVTRIAITDRSTDPALQRPFMTFVPGDPQFGAPNEDNYFGSAVFENGLTASVRTDGRVGALSGDPNTSRIVFVGSPDTFPPNTGPDNLLLIADPTRDDVFGSISRAVGGPPAGTSTAVVIDGVTQFPINTNRTAQPASVFIIDKIRGEGAAFDPTAEPDARGIQPGERFFIIGGTPLPPVAAGLPGAPPGSLARFAISDGLDPLSFNGDGTQTIADQFAGPGQAGQPAAFNRFNAFRPEQTFVPGAPRGDTHLLVMASADGRNPALRSDLQIAADGRFSASVSTGGIGVLGASLVLSGNTVGSAQLDPSFSAIALTANLGSLGTDATGQGAHVFGGSNKAPGQVGFFAVSQADIRRGAPGTEAGVQPGALDSVGSTAPVGQFAYTRLATNVGTPILGAQRGALGGRPEGIEGFAAALIDGSLAGGASRAIYAGVGANLGDVTIRSRNADLELDATVRLEPRAVGEIAATPPAAPAPANRVARTLTFGQDGTSGGAPTTAVASQASFAAVRPGQAALASVDADLLNGIRGPDGGASALPASNEHVAWGVFLGDLVPRAPGGPREFANLGFWVAGRPVDAATLQTLTGTATYAGGMVGNAVDARGMRTVAGDFAHAFDFARRQGSMSANFDGARFGIGTSINGATNVYAGAAAGTLDRTMSVQGAFFHNPAAGGAVSSANLPRATGGVFGVAGPSYGANGVFVGNRP